MPKQSYIVDFVKRAISSSKDPHPTTATVVKVDGNLADIRLEGHATNITNCRITGDPRGIKVGMLVTVVWEDYNGTLRPSVTGGSSGINLSAYNTSTVIVDNATIENSQYGLRVKAGGITKAHLAFDIEEMSDPLPGWTVSPEGIIYSNNMAINPNGSITLGQSPDIIKISTEDSTYRMWAGNINPASASFSVSKTGHLISSSATIAGWTINSTQIKKTGIILDSANDNIQIGSFGEIVLDGATTTITIGVSSPQIIIDGANKVIKSSNFDPGFAGFALYAYYGDAEFNNVKVRGTLRASVFEYGTIQSTAGTLAVGRSAGVIYNDFTTPSYYYLESGTSTVNFDVEDDKQGNARTSVGDIVRIKELTSSGIIGAHLFITAVANHTGYHTCTGVLMEGDKNQEFTKGAGFLIYGQDGSGTIFLSADETIGSNANISIATHSFGVINSVSMTNNGANYNALDVLTLTESLLTPTSNCTIRVDTVDGGGNILTYTLLTSGGNYSPGTKSVTGGAGTGAQFKITDMDGPWDSQSTRVRIGNINGSYGATASRWGMGIGDYSSGNYLSYNAEAVDTFILKAGGGYVKIDGDGIELDATQTYPYGATSIRWVSGVTDKGYLTIGDSSGNIYATFGINGVSNGKIGRVRLYAYCSDSADARSVLSIYGVVSGLPPTPEYHEMGMFWDGSTTPRAYALLGDVPIATGSTKPTTGNAGDLFVSAGLAVGTTSINPPTGDILYTSNLRPRRGTSTYTSYTYVPLTTMIHGANWWNRTLNGTSSENRTVSSEWSGVPSYAKAIQVRVHCQDSGSGPQTGLYLQMGPANATDQYDHISVHPYGDSVWSTNHGLLNISSGTVTIRWNTSGTNTMLGFIGVTGYYI